VVVRTPNPGLRANGYGDQRTVVAANAARLPGTLVPGGVSTGAHCGGAGRRVTAGPGTFTTVVGD